MGRVVRRPVIAFAFAALVVLTSSCSPVGSGGASSEGSSTSATTKSGGSTTRSSSNAGTSAKNPLDSVGDPCGLLTQGEANQLGFSSAGSSTSTAGIPNCRWRVSGEYQLSVGLVSGGLDKIDVGSGRAYETTVNGRDARRVEQSTGEGECFVSVEVSEDLRVDVGVFHDDSYQQACEIANKAAGFVEPKLPRA
ncbi:DUF3558 domain-containing protein [Goodfellowiella coeruleoviolacea]|uniref:DUF3558 domain-containing protein n=1 Tax=Goodfellowiella coeruleoviolacea TaxID=334858 RepID=UPI0038996BC5